MATFSVEALAELSPLDQIRHVEAEVARQIMVVHEEAEQLEIATLAQCQQLKQQAEQDSIAAAEVHYRQLIDQSQTVAQTHIIEAERHSQLLLERAVASIDAAVQHIMRLVIGIESNDL